MALLEKALPGYSTQIVVVQDLSQSDVVEEATEGMEERFKPGQLPLLLVDTTGDVRRAFGVPEDDTTRYWRNRSYSRTVALACGYVPTFAVQMLPLSSRTTTIKSAMPKKPLGP